MSILWWSTLFWGLGILLGCLVAVAFTLVLARCLSRWSGQESGTMSGPITDKSRASNTLMSTDTEPQKALRPMTPEKIGRLYGEALNQASRSSVSRLREGYRRSEAP